MTWYAETAGETKSLNEAPSNWTQLIMEGNDKDQIYFCGTDTTSSLIKAVSLPESGETLVPEMWTTQKVNGIDGLIQIPNYGTGGVGGRYVLAIKYDDPSGSVATIVGNSYFEAWDDDDDISNFIEPENEILAGTSGNNGRSMLRAIDTTDQVLSPGGDHTWPSTTWWSSSVQGDETVAIYNKELKGSSSFLASEYLIITPGTDYSASGTSPAIDGASFVWYIALAAVIPHDALIGMSGHRFVFNVRNFFT